MVNIQSLEPANYSAVKIRVNDAKAYNLNDGKNITNNTCNATDIEVNRPVVYTYPLSQGPITYDMAQITPFKLPQKVQVPEPSVTTTEAEKNLAFHGINFKASNNKVEILPPEDILPEVNVQEAEKNLNSEDFDVQAKQMEAIMIASEINKQGAKDYVLPEIFDCLINIITKNTSDLQKPTAEQQDARIKLRNNLIAADKANAEGVNPDDFKMPYEMTENEIKLALTLTPFEQAERNKAYALATVGILAKTYADGVEEQTGNVVPLTDLPGASVMVETLKNEKNEEVKLAALDSLRYIARPEYKEELITIFTLSAQDKSPKVAQFSAIMALMLSGVAPKDILEAA